MSFAPGEAYQFDWSHEVVLLSGTTVMVKAAHVRLCHSRMLFVRAYPRETQEMVFDAHRPVQRHLHPRHLRLHEDRRRDYLGCKGRLYNRRFLQMCSHYLVDPVACTPASGWEKGQVENQGRAGQGTLLHAAAAVQKPRRVKRLAARQMHQLRQSSSPSGAGRSDDLGRVRSRTPQTRSLCRPLRRLPRGDGVCLEDLSGALRQ
ncbi:hypothetical protein WN72_04975 [Bradyrhizobium arachidis]|uniref:Integrase catalytic domain-containing protein n=1 Tax=Bradyrhizobium arachidis TaxID=858423 RepID=A0AAE7NIW9_9BRAD|nr:hypothetical protein WN72_04975 [Bradyrhizobium arachidis]